MWRWRRRKEIKIVQEEEEGNKIVEEEEERNKIVEEKGK